MEFQDASLDPKFSCWSSWHPFFMSAMLQWMHQVTPYILEIHFSIQALPHNPNLQGWWQYGHVELQPMVQWNHGTSIRLLPRGRASFHNAHTKNNIYIYIYVFIYFYLLFIHLFIYLKKNRFPPVFFFRSFLLSVLIQKKAKALCAKCLAFRCFFSSAAFNMASRTLVGESLANSQGHTPQGPKALMMVVDNPFIRPCYLGRMVFWRGFLRFL